MRLAFLMRDNGGECVLCTLCGCDRCERQEAGVPCRLMPSYGPIIISTSLYITLFLSLNKSHLLLLGKFEYSGGPIFKVVLEC